VVNVSSAAGLAVFPLNGVHAASKHALEAVSEALAMEASPFGIPILVVQLGGVATGMYQNQQRYVSAAYADLHRAQQDSFQDARAHGASPEQAARAKRLRGQSVPPARSIAKPASAVLHPQRRPNPA